MMWPRHQTLIFDSTMYGETSQIDLFFSASKANQPDTLKYKYLIINNYLPRLMVKIGLVYSCAGVKRLISLKTFIYFFDFVGINYLQYETLMRHILLKYMH